MWLAHCVHLDAGDIRQARRHVDGSGALPEFQRAAGLGYRGDPRTADRRVPVGLGVDGVASNENGGLATELREAMLAARFRRGPRALTARQVLQMATMGGARCLGRAQELGSLEVGKVADIALWQLDGLGHADIDDPVCALVFGPPAPVRLLLVGGEPVVVDGQLQTADVTVLAREARHAARVLRRRAG